MSLRRGSLLSIQRAANDLARQISGHASFLMDHFAVDDRVVHSRRALDHPLGARREIIGPFRLFGMDRLRIENGDVCRVAWPQQAATLQTEDRSDMEGKLMNRLLQSHHLALAHPQTQQNRAVTEV